MSYPSRPIVWDIGSRRLTINTIPLVMGILNVTPDSFSDGGKHYSADEAIRAAFQMQADGADIVDIGGESTRPYGESVQTNEELDRVLPVIEGLAGKLHIPISIDTTKSEVARHAVAAGAEIINDITGLQVDPLMLGVAKTCGVGVCVMHIQGTPQTMQDNPSYVEVVGEIEAYLIARRAECEQAGIPRARICLDPGIGFGKTHEHNLQLLRATERFANLGSPLLIGHSRKGFIGKILADKTADRDAAGIGVSLAVAAAGASVIRVHAVRATVDALKLFSVCRV